MDKSLEAVMMNNEVAIKNLEIQVQEISRQHMEESHSSSQNDMVMSIEEQWEELEVEEKKRCELIEETLVPQALKKDEEEELPKEASEDMLELYCDNLVSEQEELVVECEDFKEVPIVDFVFGDKLMIAEERHISIRLYLKNSWSKRVQGKEKARGGNFLGSTQNQICENFINPLLIYLLSLAIMFENCCNTMMELGQNLHDLKGLQHFAIDPG